MEITVIRHSQTVENLQGICQGQTSGTLSERGREQALELSQRLDDECISFDLVICSDLSRAVQTAEIVFDNRVKITTDERLRERGLYAIQGEKFLPTIDYIGHLDGCESMEAMFARVQELLDEIKQRHRAKRIALLSHGITIRVITSICQKVDIHQTTLVNNCSLTKFLIP